MKQLLATSLMLLPVIAMVESEDAFAQALTVEQSYSRGAFQIKADKAWAKGATGGGVVVAVVDTGVFRHVEFGSRLYSGATSVSGTITANDDNGHGTHVAGIIAAGRNNYGMMGVAYNAYILPVKVLSSTGTGTSTSFTQGMAYTVGRARIVNMSLGAGGPFGETAMRNGVNSGQLLVAAAGNSAGASPAWPARYAKEAWAKGQVIAVGAVGANNQIASFSNRAGDTANFYLVAPGTSILSTYYNGGFAYMSGTSMATPFVSGAAAVVIGYWPYLSSAQVADILFKTATDLGAPGVDAIYGRGLVNLELALQPIGMLSVSSGGTNRTTMGTSIKVARTPYGANLKKSAASGAFKVVSTDDYGRGFETDLAGAVDATEVPYVERMLSGMDTRLALVERTLQDTTFALQYSAMPAVTDAFASDQDIRPTIAALSWSQRFANGDEGAIGWGGMGSRFFGVSASGLSPIGFAAERFSVPYLQYVPNQMHMGYSFALDSQTKVKFGFASTSQHLAAQLGLSSSIASMTAIELEKSFGPANLTLSGGQLREQNSVLGSESGQALEIGKTPATTFVSLGGTYRINNRMALSAMATLGRTAAFDNQASLISNMTRLTTASWSLGLTTRDAFRAQDSLGLSVAMPVKPLSGSMGLISPIAQNADGSLAYAAQQISLVPSATEIATELSYSAKLANQAKFIAGAAYRLHPGHYADAHPEKILGVRYQMPF